MKGTLKEAVRRQSLTGSHISAKPSRKRIHRAAHHRLRLRLGHAALDLISNCKQRAGGVRMGILLVRLNKERSSKTAMGTFESKSIRGTLRFIRTPYAENV